ncbi:MAG: hypothetical protein QUV02_11870 [Maricaulis sp.]|uniref:hypothetical protein n=1 Tax=Maricaulis sp. TaxID=1486257 RepID=UPI00260DA81D|nr:hypothetical protein [Maricaulis sp.]MDM7985138.1 hypothetical protein [Maricaulis sp.]
MSKAAKIKWNNTANGDEADYLPLSHALALYISEDLDEGLNESSTTIREVRKQFERGWNIELLIQTVSGLLGIVALSGLASAHTPGVVEAMLRLLLFVAFAGLLGPWIWRRIHQFGLEFPLNKALELPHEENEDFEKIIGFFQQANGPKAFYLPKLSKRRVALERSQFFGKLRYLLFSEHSRDRAKVSRFPSALDLSADICVHRDNIKQMCILAKHERKAGAGRNFKFAYVHAIMALTKDPRSAELDLSNEARATKTVIEWMTEWFQNNTNTPKEVPDASQLKRYAKDFVSGLKKYPPKKAIEW